VRKIPDEIPEDEYDESIRKMLERKFPGKSGVLIDKIKEELKKDPCPSDDEVMGELAKLLKGTLTDTDVMKIRDLFVIRPISVHGI
jgi:hypothetical protein